MRSRYLLHFQAKKAQANLHKRTDKAMLSLLIDTMYGLNEEANQSLGL